jgi:hypothetical protein
MKIDEIIHRIETLLASSRSARPETPQSEATLELLWNLAKILKSTISGQDWAGEVLDNPK